jgi:hypothetical protein
VFVIDRQLPSLNIKIFKFWYFSLYKLVPLDEQQEGESSIFHPRPSATVPMLSSAEEVEDISEKSTVPDPSGLIVGIQAPQNSPAAAGISSSTTALSTTDSEIPTTCALLPSVAVPKLVNNDPETAEKNREKEKEAAEIKRQKLANKKAMEAADRKAERQQQLKEDKDRLARIERLLKEKEVKDISEESTVPDSPKLIAYRQAPQNSPAAAGISSSTTALSTADSEIPTKRGPQTVATLPAEAKKSEESEKSPTVSPQADVEQKNQSSSKPVEDLTAPIVQQVQGSSISETDKPEKTTAPIKKSTRLHNRRLAHQSSAAQELPAAAGHSSSTKSRKRPAGTPSSDTASSNKKIAKAAAPSAPDSSSTTDKNRHVPPSSDDDASKIKTAKAGAPSGRGPKPGPSQKAGKDKSVEPATSSSALQHQKILPDWAKEGVRFLDQPIRSMIYSSIVPLALLLQGILIIELDFLWATQKLNFLYFSDSINNQEEAIPISTLQPLARQLFQDLDRSVIKERKLADEFPKNARECYEARKKFANNYSSTYEQLPRLFDAISQQDAEDGVDSFYYTGLPGEEFDVFGPPVEIGLEPFPMTPAASKNYMERPSYLEEESDQLGLQSQMIFEADINNMKVDVVHISDGLVVLLQEHILVRNIVEQYMLENHTSFQGPVKQFAGFMHHVIRMFWPGYSHKVFTDPRGILKQQTKPAFHQKRLDMAAKYAEIVWDTTKENLKQQIAKLKTKDNKPKVALETHDWKKILPKYFERLRSDAAQKHAIAVGFDATWYKYFTKGTNSETGRVRFFESNPVESTPSKKSAPVPAEVVEEAPVKRTRRTATIKGSKN